MSNFVELQFNKNILNIKQFGGVNLEGLRKLYI